jgi:hypothetical protein
MWRRELQTMKLTSPLPSEVGYASLSWHDSKTIEGVRFAIKRISLAQRLDLNKRVRELTLRHEFLKAGPAPDQLEAAWADLLVRKLYVEWGLAALEGFSIDGETATLELLIEKGPEKLVDEIVFVIQEETGLSEEERKNF